MERLVSTREGRRKMFVDDPLNPDGTSPEALVKASPEGFGFQCHDPSASLPSYKRSKPKECAKLATLLRDCGKLGGEDVSGSGDQKQEEHKRWRAKLKEWQTEIG